MDVFSVNYVHSNVEKPPDGSLREIG
jgi:hypothetical protein